MHKVCMIVQDPAVKGGIAAVISGYYGSKLEKDYDIKYVESYKDGSKWVKLGKALKGYWQFLGVLLFDKPELVHMHSSFGPSFYRKIPYVLLSSMWHIPIVNHIHGSEFDKLYTNAGKTKQKLVRWIWGKCTHFIVLSEYWKNRYAELVPAEKITVIENYGKLQPQRDKSNCQNTILFMGLINPMKGSEDMVDVMAAVKEQIPQARLIMAGVGDIPQIKEKADKANILSNLEFPGWVRGKEKEQLLESCDIFFLPSYTEAMPMSILEAMGYGLPIVSTNVGGIPRLVSNGQNGYLYEPGDAKNMADAIVKLLSDDDLRVSFGQESRNIIKKQYSLDVHLDKIEKIYEMILG